MSYNELKYLVPDHSLELVTRILDVSLGGSDVYALGDVDSIYYDNQSLELYRQCSEGEAIKDKFRIRGYGQNRFLQAHHKRKNTSEVLKLKAAIAPVSPEFCSNTSFLEIQDRQSIASDSDHSLAEIQSNASVYGQLYPTLRVKYKRRRFRSFDYRITLDYAIEVSGFSNGLDRHQHACRFRHSVLEVKTESQTPVLPLFGIIKLPQVSFSKYHLGIGLLMNGEDPSIWIH